MQKNAESHEPEKKKEPKAAIIFMVFGLLLIFGSLFLFQSHTEHANLSSLHPHGLQKEQESRIEAQKKFFGIYLNNQRISAEVEKDRKILDLGNKALMSVEATDPMAKDVPLSQEPNTVGNLRERSRNENEQNPDVLIPHEVESDQQDYEYAIQQEQRDKHKFLEELKKTAEQKNLDIQYDAKTGEISIDRRPQNDSSGQPGSAK
jgi:hypothetical protein